MKEIPEEDKLRASLQAIVDEFKRKDEVDRINEDLKATRRLLVVFTITVVMWAVVITALVQLSSK